MQPNSSFSAPKPSSPGMLRRACRSGASTCWWTSSPAAVTSTALATRACGCCIRPSPRPARACGRWPWRSLERRCGPKCRPRPRRRRLTPRDDRRPEDAGRKPRPTRCRLFGPCAPPRAGNRRTLEKARRLRPWPRPAAGPCGLGLRERQQRRVRRAVRPQVAEDVHVRTHRRRRGEPTADPEASAGGRGPARCTFKEAGPACSQAVRLHRNPLFADTCAGARNPPAGPAASGVPHSWR